MLQSILILSGILWASHALPPAQGENLDQVVAQFLSRAPMQLNYHYSISREEFQQDTTGTLYLAAPGSFRLTLWDKVYGSDGHSLYLHDRNTRQTVIDSLRWTDVQLWVRLLQGKLPPGTRQALSSTEHDLPVWILSHEGPYWEAAVTVDKAGARIIEIRLYESAGWEHTIRLDPPVPWKNNLMETWIRLEDLPGIRLDLR